MKYDILTVGFPMVEIMRKERNVPFDVPADFTGPYPSADTCIMLDVAARLGRSCCMLGVTGDDTFADVVTNRLSRDGVDISHMTRLDALVRNLAERGKVLFIVTHDYEFFCRTYTRALHLADGGVQRDLAVTEENLSAIREFFYVR